MGVKCKTGKFSEIYDKFDEQLPKFIAKTLFKSKLTEEEQQYITSFSLGAYNNINIEKLKEEIEHQFMYKSKLNKILLSSENDNLVIKALNERKVNLRELMSKNEQTSQMGN